MVFVISSSGVAGRQMKIKSYKRSFMVPSVSFSGRAAREILSRSRLRFLAVLGRLLAPVVAVHRRGDSFRQTHLEGVAPLADHLRRAGQLRLLHRPQDILLAPFERMFRAAAEPQPRKLLRAQGANHRFRPVVAAGAALAVNPDRAERQLHLVPHHQQLVQSHFVLLEQLAHRHATQIHESLRLCQQDFLTRQSAAAHQRLALGPFDANRAAIGQFVHCQKPEVMRRPLIFRAGIPKPHNEPHKISGRVEPRKLRYFFFSAFSGFAASGSAPSSPSTSFLPFLMTSGSAGATATSAAAASTGFSSSTRSATTCAITRSGSVMSFIFAGSIGSSPARRCLPISSSLTSMRNSAGISVGRHSISTSRVTVSKMPPCCLTPAGSPN